jgi:hypothetical protein
LACTRGDFSSIGARDFRFGDEGVVVVVVLVVVNEEDGWYSVKQAVWSDLGQ